MKTSFSKTYLCWEQLFRASMESSSYMTNHKTTKHWQVEISVLEWWYRYGAVSRSSNKITITEKYTQAGLLWVLSVRNRGTFHQEIARSWRLWHRHSKIFWHVMMRYKQISRSKIEVIEVDIYIHIYVMGWGLRGFELIIHDISSTHTYIHKYMYLYQVLVISLARICWLGWREKCIKNYLLYT